MEQMSLTSFKNHLFKRDTEDLRLIYLSRHIPYKEKKDPTNSPHRDYRYQRFFFPKPRDYPNITIELIF